MSQTPTSRPPTSRRVFRVVASTEKLPHTDTHMKAGEHEPGYLGVVMAPAGRIHSGDMLLLCHQEQHIGGFVYTTSGDRPDCIKDTYDVFTLEVMGIKAILSIEVEDRLNSIFTDPSLSPIISPKLSP